MNNITICFPDLKISNQKNSAEDHHVYENSQIIWKGKKYIISTFSAFQLAVAGSLASCMCMCVCVHRGCITRLHSSPSPPSLSLSLSCTNCTRFGVWLSRACKLLLSLPFGMSQVFSCRCIKAHSEPGSPRDQCSRWHLLWTSKQI